MYNSNGSLDPLFSQTRNRRIGQAIVVMYACVGALALLTIVIDPGSVMFPALTFTMIFLALSLALLRFGHPQYAAGITVFVMFACIAQAMWEGAGVRSPALLGYPGVLLFALVLVGKRTFYVSLMSMLAYMTVLLYANQQGWRPGPSGTEAYVGLLSYGIILCAAAFTVRVLASDLMCLLDAVNAEKEALAKSRLKAEHLANHDTLTGLPNRRMAENYFNELSQHRRMEDSSLGLVFVDVDNFKKVNDSLGHQAGDDLLCHLGKTIGGQLRKSDRLVRIAGDEFLILLPGIRNTKNVEFILKKVYQAIAKPVLINGENFTPALSMGITLMPKHGEDFKELLKKADHAMYQAKAAGRNQYKFYQPEAPSQENQPGVSVLHRSAPKAAALRAAASG